MNGIEKMSRKARLGRSFGAVVVAVGVPMCLVIGCGGLFGGGGSGDAVTSTVDQTFRPIALPPGAPQDNPNEVAKWAADGYMAYRPAPGDDQGKKYDLMPVGYAGAENTAQLLSYFTMSDVHITDKESPAEAPYFGWASPYHGTGLLSSSYSPVMLSSTQVLNAAVKTINALHRKNPMDFGLLLGDACNSSQTNELRWYIDVMDGKQITPSSGDHLGAGSIDYQKPFKAEGIDSTLPWYACIGNHDQFWMGIDFPSAKIQAAQVGTTVMQVGPNIFAPGNSDLDGVYVGLVDGTSKLGNIIKGGAAANFSTPPTVAADPTRVSLTTTTPFSKNWVTEFFNTTSLPVGHGFSLGGSGSTFACYSFLPKAALPIKVIVLDDTCKTTGGGGPTFYGDGWIDADRLAWLTAELQAGQDNDQLMILACHIPINPQKDLFDPTPAPQFYSSSLKSDAEMITFLQGYPNLMLVMAGHRHLNVVTPHPSTDVAHPENGFWEVETSSLRDFPQQFRHFDIRRNTDNSISIMARSVDPSYRYNSPEWKSRGYAFGAIRVYGDIDNDDTTSHTYNAELFKLLTPAMQTKISTYGQALSHVVSKTSAAPATKATTTKTTKSTNKNRWSK